MGVDRSSRVRIESLEPDALTARLKTSAERVSPGRVMDGLELRHLVRVVTECSMLLKDVYTDSRIARIMEPDRLVDRLVQRFLDRAPDVEGQERYLVKSLPDDVRRLADKALFDHGLLGRREVKGYDLTELGTRAYLAAGEMLEMLAEDRRLKRFFQDNTLARLPIEEEVVFLRQCADKFNLYADVLKGSRTEDPVGLDAPLTEVPTTVEFAGAIGQDLRDASDRTEAQYAEAAQGGYEAEAILTRDQLLSAYERILLFSSLDLDKLRGGLESTVIDQPRAIEALCDEFSLFAAGTRDLRRPPAYFLVGPTGVGKNYLVESLGRALAGLWKIEIPTLTIEGPNYTYPSDINELKGATRGFIRSDEDGILTTFHEKSSRAPLAIILVDEVEKAHPQLITFFLSILDRGTTTDNRGTVLNFSNCLIFFTSNLGYSDRQQDAAMVGFVDGEQRATDEGRDIRRDLRRALKPEFVNRLRLVYFDRLTRDSAEHILDLELAKITRRYEEFHGLRLALDDDGREELIRRGFSAAYGARKLSATLESVCNVEIAKKIRKEDGCSTEDRAQLIEWLREVRDGQRAYDADEVRTRVMDLARVRPGYEALSIGFDGAAFTYTPVDP
jgi:hypothetical protein